MSTFIPEFQQGDSIEVASTFIQLGSTLWVDLESGILILNNKEILLTAREFEVLRLLIHVMRTSRGYLSASAVAQRLALTNVFDPEHCIEQTISGLRRKMGEAPHQPHILRGRRGLGYRLFPDHASR